jgi:hypothetical protein
MAKNRRTAAADDPSKFPPPEDSRPKAPPCMAWRKRVDRPADGPGRGPNKEGQVTQLVLQANVKLIDGGTIRAILNTTDPKIAKQRLRPLVAKALADVRLRPDSRAALLYGCSALAPMRPDRPYLGDAEFDAEIDRLRALSLPEYEAQREAAAKRLGSRVVRTVDLLVARPRPDSGKDRTRRYRARKRGQRTAMGTSWHHRPRGQKCFSRNSGGVMHGRIQLAGHVYSWSLGTRDDEVAAVIMAPVVLARELVHAAGVQVLNCGPGTLAAAAAAAKRAEACRRLAEAIIAAGGPMKLAKIVREAPSDERDADDGF